LAFLLTAANLFWSNKNRIWRILY